MRKIIIASAFVFIALTTSYAQFSCTAGEMSQKQYDKHPELLAAKHELDSFTAVYVQQQQAQRAQRVAGISYVIPVVFHILHEGGSENIPDSLVYAEMQHWNQYMSMTNPELSHTVPSFVNILGNPQIEFRLAQKDPNGNCTNGIEHIYTTSTYAGDDNTKLNPWPREKYLNVWLSKAIQKDTSNYGILAYAFYPAAVTSYANNDIIDGIIAKYFVVGSNSSFSRPTLGHECGHWMNLEHTWGNTNNPGVACGDDEVNDTPITEGDQNVNPITEARCLPGIVENVQNIMNYADQHFMFTQGQVDRMHAALHSSVSGRDSIWSASNLLSTGTDQPLTYPNPNSCAVPIAEFAVKNRYGCVGSNIAFKDVSYNAAYQTREWTFPGDANITSSTDANPVVQFGSPGWKEVTLQVSNANGSSQKTKTMVYINTGNPISAPYIETFEDTNEVNANWAVLNYDNNNTFFRWYPLGHYSNGSYELNTYNSNYDGDRDELVLPSLDLTSLPTSDMTIEFDYSFATWDQSHMYDSIASLAILSSIDCGSSWKTIYYNPGGYNLYNGGILTTGPYYVARQDQYWKHVTVTLPSNLRTGNTNLKFQVIGAKGANQFYIDNVNVGRSLDGISTLQASSIGSLNVQPNPASGQATVILETTASGDVDVSLYDMTGREISRLYQGPLGAGAKNITLNTENISSGIYLIKATDGRATLQRRFVKM